MPSLFDPFQLKGLQLKNRVMMSPMCQYSVIAQDGAPNEWHQTHYISRAVAGTGLIMMEATAIEPNGRISYEDLGLWSEEQLPAFQRIIEACQSYGSKVGIQVAHAGRKAMLTGSDIVAPTSEPFSDKLLKPRELTTDEIKQLVESFARTARLAVKAGVDTLELHGAHGYLIHQFLSPLTNQRDDVYGERTLFAREVIAAVKAEIPSDMPLMIRVSSVEYGVGGYGIEEMVAMCKEFKQAGIDAIDASSGGNTPIPPSVYPGYQAPYAAQIKREVDIPVIAVGMLEEPALAQHYVQSGQVDIIAIARGMLRDPYWTNTTSLKLGAGVQVPKQYARAF